MECNMIVLKEKKIFVKKKEKKNQQDKEHSINCVRKKNQ
jgi:hypothetical protein